MENNCLNLMNLLQNILISKEMVYHLKNKKRKLLNLLTKVQYKYKTKGISPKELFKGLRERNINPKKY